MENQMHEKHPFENFLEEFIPQVSKKSEQLNKLLWILETTGSSDAAELKAEFDTEFKMLFNNRETYEKLLQWDKQITDLELKRQLKVLLRSFKENMMPKEILEKISAKEAEIAYSYATFRPLLDGKPATENQIREILKTENDPEIRKRAWEASKEIGVLLGPKILELAEFRNEGARAVGYPDYFQMQLELQEVDPHYLDKIFSDLAERSNSAYESVLDEIAQKQSKRFKVPLAHLGPWAWAEPFCQEDPLESKELDTLVSNIDILKVGKQFFTKMGFDIEPILKGSDLYEREGKNQHAFCINMDRHTDIRTLNNIKPQIKWLEIVLHELGHAVYELGFDDKLPWLLREPPAMAPTEAMALICGRQAYHAHFLEEVLGSKDQLLNEHSEQGLRRRQLIFSRWVLVVTEFERNFYANPRQDLNALWWDLVEKYQKIPAPEGRQGKADWASKYHIGLAPAYYYSYLIGELFASSLNKAMLEKAGAEKLWSAEAGTFLTERLFFPGNRYRWDELMERVLDEPLSLDPWIEEFAQ